MAYTSKNTLHLRTLLFAAVAFIVVNSISKCHAFATSSYYVMHHKAATTSQRKSNYYPLPLFRELITDDDNDLRADIAVIKKQDGLDDFLKVDDRLCVIKLYAPWCKKCRAFGVKFRKLATENGDRMNAAGEVIRSGDARFGEIEYSSNVKLCKSLKVKKFPTVLIFRGGKVNEKLSEIVCNKQSVIEDILAEMSQLITSST